MPLDNPNKPPTPPLLPRDLMKEWVESQKEAKKEANEDTKDNQDSEAEPSESEFPSPAQVAAQLGDEPEIQSTEADKPAEPETSGSGVPLAGRRRR